MRFLNNIKRYIKTLKEKSNYYVNPFRLIKENLQGYVDSPYVVSVYSDGSTEQLSYITDHGYKAPKGKPAITSYYMDGKIKAELYMEIDSLHN